jgi:predicted metal-dependent phosphoesterase TrpH
MNDFRADLHCHSTCSDGTLSPVEIIELARSIDLKGLSITDHDTIDAYEQVEAIAKEYNFPLISGVEFSAALGKKSVHMLAYSFSLQSKAIHDFCLRHKQRRSERNQMIIDLLAAQGMPLKAEDVRELFSNFHSSIGRPHIALAMIKNGYVSSIQQAFSLYIGEGKPCFAPGKVFSVEETLDVIHQANGIAVIAHPHLIDDVKIVKDLLTMNFDGIEAYYGRFPAAVHERWLKIANRKNWLITGGSDFHGTIKPNLPLGSSWVGEESFSILQERYLSNSDNKV